MTLKDILMNIPPFPILMGVIDLLFRFSFVFSYASLLFRYPFRCQIKSQTFLILQGVAADLLCPKPIFTGIITRIWYHMNPHSYIHAPSHADLCSVLFGLVFPPVG